MSEKDHLSRLANSTATSWNQWREDNPKLRPNLRHAEIWRVRRNLMFYNFSSADLRGAVLTGLDLRWASLVQANLTDARLSSSDLAYADFTGATLRKANLVDADFDGAKVSGADFSGAGANSTQFGNLDLRNVVGLREMVHWGPSTVGIDTLVLSKGMIPTEFLVGCGVPKSFLDAVQFFEVQPIQFYSCFISYSHSDCRFASRLYTELQAREVRCWLDQHDLRPGDRIIDAIDSAIRLHDRLLLCCSKASLISWWVKDEVRKALERERKEERTIILPLMLDRFLLDEWSDGLAADLRSRLAIDFTGWSRSPRKFAEALQRLLTGLAELPARP